MRILQILPNLYLGGAERFVVDLSNELIIENEVKICLLENLVKDCDFIKDLNSNVELIELSKVKGFDYKLFSRLYKVIKKYKPDIVHCHLNGVDYAQFISPLFPNIKFVHTIHNDAEKEQTVKFIRRIRWIFFACKLVHPITISEKSDLSFAKVYNLNSRTLIYNGRPIVDKSPLYIDVSKQIESYKFNSDTAVFTNVAGVWDSKNQKLLIEVFRELLEEGENVLLIQIGEVRDVQYYNELIPKLMKGIYFLGKKSNVNDYLLCSDFFTLSSKFEGMPISLIEAFSAKCIPCCTPAGGVVDMIVNGKNGFLASSHDKEDFKSIIMEGIRMTKKNKDYFKDNCFSEFKNKYHIGKCASNYLSLFNILLEKK